MTLQNVQSTEKKDEGSHISEFEHSSHEGDLKGKRSANGTKRT